MKVKDGIFWRLLFGLILSACVFFIKEWAWQNFLFKAQYENGIQKEYVVYDELRRSYIFHLPKNDNFFENESVPLFFVLHGASGNADQIMENTGMNKIADKENFIVVYPNGTGLFSEYVLSWYAGQCCNFIEPLGVDDVGFIKFLIDKFKEEYNIDKDRIYVAGLSNGGMMSYRLGCELTDSFAAIASVVGSMMISDCNPTDYLSVVGFNDVSDNVVPYEGGQSDNWFVDLFDIYFNSASESISFWVKHNDCSGLPKKSSIDGVDKEVYTDCKDNKEVLFFTLRSGVHDWPGSNYEILFTAKQESQKTRASEIIWDFFKKHTK